MRRVPLEYIREGHYNAKQIYTTNGQMLIGADVKLSQLYIDKLRAAGFQSLYIHDEFCEAEITEVIKPQLMAQIETISKNITRLASAQLSIITKKEEVSSSITDFEEILDQIMFDLIENTEVVNNLMSISTYDDFTFKHSLNMMMIALVMGNELGLNQIQMKELAMGCMFHDIGKLFVPKEILNKPGRLTKEEFKLIQEHPRKGFEFMREYTNLSAMSRIIALEHHEKQDGSGYPENKIGGNTHWMSKICTVSDVFEALIADRPYRPAIEIGNAREYIMGNGGTAFDINMVECFIKAINPYPKDTRVLLSDGREGIVTQVNMDFNTRPVVTIHCEEKKRVTPYTVDLIDNLNLVISKTIYLFSFEN
ncbi:MAG: HD-GYP domain-containing protein [Lachnospiraceae bacterium]|nr:HD-GYP domain-containing protein [Lachnospiraceae bacterium]